MDRVETVEVYRPDLPGGKLIINKADFDPATMRIYSEAIEKQEEKPQSRKKENRK